jgi:hypothetical protein
MLYVYDPKALHHILVKVGQANCAFLARAELVYSGSIHLRRNRGFHSVGLQPCLLRAALTSRLAHRTNDLMFGKGLLATLGARSTSGW